MGIYLSSIQKLLPEYAAEFGYIQTMDNADGTFRKPIEAGYRWMLDNGVFSGRFDADKWQRHLVRWRDYTTTCIGVVVPDVLHRTETGVIGDWRATVRQFQEYAPIVKDYGYPVAFVSQDGLPVDAAPWADFDVLFIGGSDQHKLTESWPLIAEAQRRGKWVHVGRVNSEARCRLFWMADSWDGTDLSHGPTIAKQKKYVRAMRWARTMKQQGSLLDDLHHPLSWRDCAG